MIRHLRYLGLLLPLFTFSSWAAEQNPAVHISLAGSQSVVYGPAENFTGRVRVDPLFKPDNNIRVRQLAQVLREHSENDAATRAEKALQQALANN